MSKPSECYVCCRCSGVIYSKEYLRVVWKHSKMIEDGDDVKPHVIDGDYYCVPCSKTYVFPLRSAD